MKAYYYAIFENITGDLITEGIIRDCEDRIYPAQDTGIETLPYECEAHHFKANGYTLKGFEIDIPSKDITKYKV